MRNAAAPDLAQHAHHGSVRRYGIGVAELIARAVDSPGRAPCARSGPGPGAKLRGPADVRVRQRTRMEESHARRQPLYSAIVALVVAIIAAVLGFGGIAGAAADIAKILFWVFLVIFLVVLVMNFIGQGQGTDRLTGHPAHR